MNSLHCETLQWIGDGSNDGTLTQNGNDLNIASASPGTPFNVRLDSEKATQDYYLAVKINNLQGNLSIGAISKDEFHPGWKAKGMLYNGNLTNGSSALKVDWGPRFQAGESIGVRVSHASGNDALEVTFYKNGNCLGTGFRLANNNITFYPCLHVTGSASVTVETPPELPSTHVAPEERSGCFGDWKLEKAKDGENQLVTPDRPIKFILSEDANGGIKMHFKVGNNLGGNAKIIEQTETTMKIECDPFIMTRMMPPPELRPLETLISTKKMTTISLEEDGSTLVVSGPEMRTEWSRFVRQALPLQHY